MFEAALRHKAFDGCGPWIFFKVMSMVQMAGEGRSLPPTHPPLMYACGTVRDEEIDLSLTGFRIEAATTVARHGAHSTISWRLSRMGAGSLSRES